MGNRLDHIDALILRQRVARWLYFAAGLIIGLGVFAGYYYNRLEHPEYKPLMLHTISRGGAARVVYLEAWEDSTSWASCVKHEIVWPAGASQGYIDYMLEHKSGKITHEYRRVGWWEERKAQPKTKEVNE